MGVLGVLGMSCGHLSSASELNSETVGTRGNASRGRICLYPHMAKKSRGIPPYDHFQKTNQTPPPISKRAKATFNPSRLPPPPPRVIRLRPCLTTSAPPHHHYRLPSSGLARTPDGVSCLVQAMPAWSVKTRRIAMRDIRYTPVNGPSR